MTDAGPSEAELALSGETALAEAHRAGYRRGQEEMRERCAEAAKQYFVGMFTGWIGYTGESLISLDDAEDAASECGPICADAIRDLPIKGGDNGG